MVQPPLLSGVGGELPIVMPTLPKLALLSSRLLRCAVPYITSNADGESLVHANLLSWIRSRNVAF
jgi:hypothetical protein